MAINTKDVQTGGGGTPKILQPGNRTIKINSIYLEEFPFKENAYHIILEAEGPEMGDDFEGFFIDKDDESKGRHAGQVGRVKSSEWAFADASLPGGSEISRDDEMLKFLKNFCEATGCVDWFEGEDGKHDTIETLVHKINEDKPFLGKYVSCCLGGREYENKQGYTNYDLFFPKFTRNSIPFEAETAESGNVTTFNPELHIKKKKPAEVDNFSGGEEAAAQDFELPAEETSEE